MEDGASLTDDEEADDEDDCMSQKYGVSLGGSLMSITGGALTGCSNSAELVGTISVSIG